MKPSREIRIPDPSVIERTVPNRDGMGTSEPSLSDVTPESSSEIGVPDSPVLERTVPNRAGMGISVGAATSGRDISETCWDTQHTCPLWVDIPVEMDEELYFKMKKSVGLDGAQDNGMPFSNQENDVGNLRMDENLEKDSSEHERHKVMEAGGQEEEKDLAYLKRRLSAKRKSRETVDRLIPKRIRSQCQPQAGNKSSPKPLCTSGTKLAKSVNDGLPDIYQIQKQGPLFREKK